MTKSEGLAIITCLLKLAHYPLLIEVYSFALDCRLSYGFVNTRRDRS